MPNSCQVTEVGPANEAYYPTLWILTDKTGQLFAQSTSLEP